MWVAGKPVCLWCGHEAAFWIWSFWIGGVGSLDHQEGQVAGGEATGGVGASELPMAPHHPSTPSVGSRNTPIWNAQHKSGEWGLLSPSYR